MNKLKIHMGNFLDIFLYKKIYTDKLFNNLNDNYYNIFLDLLDSKCEIEQDLMDRMRG